MKRILVVDDDQQFLRMVTVMLREANHQVGIASSGDTALAMLDKDGPWDLVLCDILMPDRDGVETILEIRKRDKSQKIIAMSGGGRTMYPQQVLDSALSIGARGVLYKPFTMPELLKVIDQVMNAEAGSSH